MSEHARILEVTDTTGRSVGFEVIDDSVLVTHDELVGARRDLRRARTVLEEASTRIAAAEERAAAAETRAAKLEARVLDLEWRLTIDAELAARNIPEGKRQILRRLCIAERPTDVVAWLDEQKGKL